MRDAIKRGEVPGAVTLVATPDKILHFAATGNADARPDALVKKDSIFAIMSMTKPVIGAALLMLQDDGKLSIDDPVSKYIPEFADLKTADGKPANVTIKQLMTHTSGMSDISKEEAAPITTLAELIPIYTAKPVHFKPGTQWAYCQSGINTMGRLIEVVSGKNLVDFLDQRLFGPLGMKDTTFYLTKENTEKRLAQPYQLTKEGKFAPSGNFILLGMQPFDTNRFPAANGGLYSTAGDYLRFAQMLLNNGTLDGKQYLKPETVKLFSSNQTGDLRTGFTDGNCWGLGCGIVRNPQGPTASLSPGTYGHGGAFGTQAWIDPEKKLIYILMVQRTNYPNGDASQLRAEFQAAALKAAVKQTPTADKPDQAQKKASYPEGKITKHAFNTSKIYPGTVRDYWVYVPKQYDGKKPACLFVSQDGIRYDAPTVFDELIAKGEMPVTIGVFVMPGRVPAPTKNGTDRFNRSFEYDGLGDDYVRFINEEILPDVESRSTADGRKISLSKDGNDRAIAGSSSGAICAFNAAWERPDSFSRIFSSVGTYVGLRGANEFPTLIRKVEPKPLRIFMQGGSSDLNIFAGDWWMVNQEMQRALEFAGYEVKHVWGTGGHNEIQATEVFPDAMRWLWKDWPTPIKRGLGSKQLQEVLIPGEDWELVGEGYQFTEGPTANPQGEVFFNDIPASKTYKIDKDGKPQVVVPDSKRANGMAYGPDGKRYVVATGTEQILAYDADGKESVIADGFRGNDLCVMHNGGMYVTSPVREKPADSKVWYISPKGEKKVVDTGLTFPNGVTLSPDQTLLYVADSRTHLIYSYQIQPDGSLKYKQRYYHLHVPDDLDESGADGIRADRDGRLYVATRMGIQVCDPIGRVTCMLPLPFPNKRATNVCFGGPNFDTLYVTAGDRVFKRKLKVQGAKSFEAPVKTPNPPL
ncbi:MAG: serine hydrolase [Planctomycetota bacterium]|nr:serine hydrolase [Planctomycetota bacterium]